MRRIVIALTLWLPSFPVLAADGVTNLPSDITPLLSMAGIWQPVDQQYVSATNSGGLANTFAGTFKANPGGAENVIVTGWVYSSSGQRASSITPVNFAIFEQQPDGTMKFNTSKFLSSSITNGGGSVIVTDFNGDGYDDIFLAAHNESPFIAMPSTALLSTGMGTFNKATLNDRVMAHDAELAMINGVPTVVTATFPSQNANQPADSFPFYQFKNGAFTQIFPPVLGRKNSIGFQSLVIDQFSGPGKYEAIFGDLLYGPGVPYVSPSGGFNPGVFKIGVYPFDGNDIGNAPNQLVSAYFNNRVQYAGINSQWGPANTHTYRLRIDDFNHDGFPDLIALGSLWSAGSITFPASLQLLQNDGTGKFLDVSDTLATNINPRSNESDYMFQVHDLDNSGINSYSSGTSLYDASLPNSSNYLLVNDGTGMLYFAIGTQFDSWSNQAKAFLIRNLPPGYSCSNYKFKFIPYRTANGKINYLGMHQNCTMSVNGVATNVYPVVNVPAQLDLRAMYTAPMTVQNRNGSRLIRTFAGNDTIKRTLSDPDCSIDGGLGTNTAVYPGNRTAWIITKSGDTIRVRPASSPGGTDTLTRVQRAQFDDQTVDLTSLADSATNDARTDCLFNWAEINYPTLFAPANGRSGYFAPYYFRFYPATNTYLAANLAEDKLKYLGPLSSNSILDVGPVATWYGTSGCR